ncbi:MAG: hypothetical protein JRC77_00120 [Deltaproteobacteria bacterium]|nr:hypothetical protein [Deltaproteobacteria bacterium]
MNILNSFGRNLLFALVTAGGYPVYAAIFVGPLSPRAVFISYLTLCASSYLFGVARGPARATGAAALCVASGAFLWLSGLSAGFAGMALAVCVGVLRSGLLHAGDPEADPDFRPSFVRSFFIEAFLILGGLTLARFMLSGGLFPIPLAIWGFFLVQSGFTLVGGLARQLRETADSENPGDPFEQACRQAYAVIESSNPSTR